MNAFKFKASDDTDVHCYHWAPKTQPKAVIHIAHGMGEHAARYDWVASQLTDAGFYIYASDHRGHGQTADKLGQFGPDGWNRTLLDLREMIIAHKANHRDLPIVLLGHSMGSMLAQQYIELHGETVDAAVLSGSPGFTHPLLSWVARVITIVETWRCGDERVSGLLKKLVFDNSNANFETNSSEGNGFEWLSRDRDQVHAYVDDKMCGFVPFPASLKLMFTGAHWTQKKQNVGKIPASLPIYLFSGSADPVHSELKNVERLLEKYRHAGLTVDTRYYADGRHEMFNEINRDEVITDLLAWLTKTLASPAD